MKFTVSLIDGRMIEAEGETIALACAKALPREDFPLIESYEDESEEIFEVAYQADCDCDHDDWNSCNHDLELAGILTS